MDEILLLLSNPAVITLLAYLAGAFIFGALLVTGMVYLARYFGYL